MFQIPRLIATRWTEALPRTTRLLAGLVLLFLLPGLLRGQGNADAFVSSPTADSTPSSDDTLRFWGAVLPLEKVELTAKHEGVISSLSASPGTDVQARQIVVSLDSNELSARYALAEQELLKATEIVNDDSTIRTAEAQLAKVEATYESMLKLKHQSELESFRLQMDVRDKQAMLAAATARHRQELVEAAIKAEQLKLARLQLEAADISSPFKGIVSEQLKFPGEFVRPGEPILRLIRVDTLIFRVELDMRKVAPHQIANFVAEAVFHCGQDQLAIAGLQFDQIIPNNLDSQNYYAQARFENVQLIDAKGRSHWRIRPGMSGEVMFTPNHALHSSLSGLSGPRSAPQLSPNKRGRVDW